MKIGLGLGKNWLSERYKKYHSFRFTSSILQPFVNSIGLTESLQKISIIFFRIDFYGQQFNLIDYFFKNNKQPQVIAEAIFISIPTQCSLYV